MVQEKWLQLKLGGIREVKKKRWIKVKGFNWGISSQAFRWRTNNGGQDFWTKQISGAEVERVNVYQKFSIEYGHFEML